MVREIHNVYRHVERRHSQYFTYSQYRKLLRYWLHSEKASLFSRDAISHNNIAGSKNHVIFKAYPVVTIFYVCVEHSGWPSS